MPKPETIGAMDDWWAGVLGCAQDDLRAPGVRVAPHGEGMRGYRGVWAFRRGDDACVISVPPGMVAPLTPVFARHSADEVFAPQPLYDILRHPIERIVGPSYIGIADETDLRPSRTRARRRLTPADADALTAFGEACNLRETEYVDVDLSAWPIFGCFTGRLLIAIGSYAVKDDHVAFLGVITHPHFRRQGYGSSAATAAAEDALRNGHVLCWQTERGNAGSVALATSMGLADYASHYAVRFRAGL